MTRRDTRMAAAMVISATALLFGWTPAASAGPVPFSDPNAVGYIGLCDQNGHQVRSGDIGAAPFAVKAVSSVPAPSTYGVAGGNAVLNVYQPRKDVDPGDWSGKQMTAGSTYTNATYPMTQGTGRDPALVDFVSVFPPKWDGLVQLRMYFSAPNRPAHSRPYPATVLRVSGNRWTEVGGGDVRCNAGKATSFETVALPSKALASPSARSTPGASVKNGSKSGAGAHAGTGKAGASSEPDANDSGPNGAQSASLAGADSASADRSSSPSGWAAGAWILFGIAVVAGAVTAVLRWRRRPVV